jgi:hypothetical protein
MRAPVCLLAAAVLLAIAVSAESQTVRPAKQRHEVQSTQLISRAVGGGAPNGPSSNAVISNDRRWARIIGFESEASNLVRKDTNGVRDVFIVRRAGSYRNNGSRWTRGKTVLISRGRSGPANGPSYAAAVDGSFWTSPSCVAFLSAASNLVAGDNNGKVDAFVSRGPGGLPSRVSLPGGVEAGEDTTEVAMSGDCSRIAFVTGGRLYVLVGGRVRAVHSGAAASQPSFSTGFTNDLVFTGKRGVYMSRGGTKRAKLIAPGGRNPVYSDIHKPPPNCKRRTIAYEVRRRGRWHIAARIQGRGTMVLSKRRKQLADRDSRNPVIGNAGCYVTFESDATNLGLNATRRKGDFNRRPDVFLYTAVRQITLVQSVKTKAIPLSAGGHNPSMSFYANYIVFDSVAPLRDQFPRTSWQDRVIRDSQYQDPMQPPSQPAPAPAPRENRQIYMRYLGPV